MAITYLKDLKNPSLGTNAIDYNYDNASKTVKVNSYNNPTGISFKSGQGMQYGLGYDPASMQHYIADPAAFYGAMKLTNPYGTGTGNPANTYVQPKTNIQPNSQISAVLPKPTTPPANMGVTTTTSPKPQGVAQVQPQVQNVNVDPYNTKALVEKAMGMLNTPQQNVSYVSPNQEYTNKAMQLMQNPQNVPYQQVQSQESEITKMYEAQKQSAIAELKSKIASSIAEQNRMKQALPGQYQPLKNEADYRGYQNVDALKEIMANKGLSTAGVPLSLMTQARTAADQNINQLNAEQASKALDYDTAIQNLQNEEIAGINKLNADAAAQIMQAVINERNRVGGINEQRQQNAVANALQAYQLGQGAENERVKNINEANRANVELAANRSNQGLSGVLGLIGALNQGRSIENQYSLGEKQLASSEKQAEANRALDYTKMMGVDAQGNKTLDAKMAAETINDMKFKQGLNRDQLEAQIQNMADQTGLDKERLKENIRQFNESNNLENRKFELQEKATNSDMALQYQNTLEKAISNKFLPQDLALTLEKAKKDLNTKDQELLLNQIEIEFLPKEKQAILDKYKQDIEATKEDMYQKARTNDAYIKNLQDTFDLSTLKFKLDEKIQTGQLDIARANLMLDQFNAQTARTKAQNEYNKEMNQIDPTQKYLYEQNAKNYANNLERFTKMLGEGRYNEITGKWENRYTLQDVKGIIDNMSTTSLDLNEKARLLKDLGWGTPSKTFNNTQGSNTNFINPVTAYPFNLETKTTSPKVQTEQPFKTSPLNSINIQDVLPQPNQKADLSLKPKGIMEKLIDAFK